MEYIILAKKTLSRQDKEVKAFCDRVKEYLEKGLFKFKPSYMPYTQKISSTTEEMIQCFVKYSNLLTHVTPGNIVAYIDNDEWVITFSEQKTLGQWGKVYFRLKESDSKDFLEILTIKEINAKFQIDWVKADADEEDKEFFTWKVYFDWIARFQCGIQYESRREISFLDSSCDDINTQEGLLKRVSIKSTDRSYITREFVFYFTRVINPVERAYFAGSIPLNVELLAWEEEKYYNKETSKELTQLKVTVKYKKEYLDIW